MNTAAKTFTAGMPVEVAKIEGELKKLWEQGGEVMTRASLINLAVYSEAPGSLLRNTQVISEITEDHACRAIVISAEPDAAEDRVEAWISAHCHVSRAGKKQICSEQLSFSLRGSFAKLLPNIVFSHLDSDLPLYLWWQGEFQDPMDPQLWSWVDRLVYDSRDWRDCDAQMRLVETAQNEAKQRIVLCDLNWTRLVQLRLAIAQFFDPPATHQCITDISRLEIDYAPGFRSTAVLLAAWFAAQLQWQLVDTRFAQLRFAKPSGEAVEAALTERDGEVISRCVLFSGRTELRVSHAPDADLLDVSAHSGSQQRMHQLMPAGSDEPVRLMSEELMRGGPHHVYLRALNLVRKFA